MLTAAFVHRYASDLASDLADDGQAIYLPLDGLRADPELRGELLSPLVVRDSLLALGEILASDLRRRPQDRSDYLAYLQAQGRRTTQALWEAQKAYLQARYGEAVAESAPLDPLLTVSPTGASFEVFSQDEASYARLDLRAGEAYRAEAAAFGTSHFRLTPRLITALEAIRSQRIARLYASATGADRERTVNVPYRWLRAFGQVQTAATLTTASLELAPMDLYNVLQQLRLNRAKKSPRALRYELVPGLRPRLVLEPWEWVMEATGPVYKGLRPLVVRTWGRQRLSPLGRLLPHMRKIDVHLLGPGLPAFYVVDLGVASLTLSLSGWTDSGWAGIATFDLLVPDAVDELLARRAVNQLQATPANLTELTQALGQPRQRLRQALLQELLRGSLVFDIQSQCFRHRPLTAKPLDLEQLRYRDPREAEAHRLLAVPDQVQLTRIHDLGAEGTAIDGEVDDRQAHRRYHTSFTLDREGSTHNASCTCRQFRRSQLKEGPCPHMMALRIAYARQRAALEQARQTPEGRQLIRAETRVLSRRQGEKLMNYRITLDDRQVVVRWGDSDAKPRMQRLLFTDADKARRVYFERLEYLGHRGYIDASSGVV